MDEMVDEMSENQFYDLVTAHIDSKRHHKYQIIPTFGGHLTFLCFSGSCEKTIVAKII